MDEMKALCALIVALMDEYSEFVVEDGTLSFRFDCDDYHYECKVERTLMDGGEDEKTDN